MFTFTLSRGIPYEGFTVVSSIRAKTLDAALRKFGDRLHKHTFFKIDVFDAKGDRAGSSRTYNPAIDNDPHDSMHWA